MSRAGMLALVMAASCAHAFDLEALVQSGVAPHAPKSSTRSGNVAAAEPHICTEKELADQAALEKSYREAMTAHREAQLAAERAEKNKTRMHLQNVFAEYIKPFGNTMEAGRDMLVEALQPALKDLLEVVLVALSKSSGKASKNASKFDLGKAGRSFIGSLEASQQREHDALVVSFRKLDAMIAKRAQEEFPVVANLLTRLPPSPPADLEHLLPWVATFYKQTVGPFFMSMAVPEMSRVWTALSRVPENRTELQKFIDEVVTPLLSQECRDFKATLDKIHDKLDDGTKPESMDNIFGILPMFADMSKTWYTCANSTGRMILPDDMETVRFDSRHLSGMPSAPAPLACSTCSEMMTSQLMDPSSKRSCAMQCSPLIMACVGGVTDSCIRSSPQCLTCFRNRMKELDTCTGHSDHAAMLTRLEAISKAMATGSVKASGVDAFARRLSSAIVRGGH